MKCSEVHRLLLGLFDGQIQRIGLDSPRALRIAVKVVEAVMKGVTVNLIRLIHCIEVLLAQLFSNDWWGVVIFVADSGFWQPAYRVISHVPGAIKGVSLHCLQAMQSMWLMRCACCRFDRQISIDRPDITGREQIFRIHLARLKLSQPVDYFSERLAALTPGFAGGIPVLEHFQPTDPRVRVRVHCGIPASEKKDKMKKEDFQRTHPRVRVRVRCAHVCGCACQVPIIGSRQEAAYGEV